MELNYLREFVVLADVLHFQEAANVLFISQSSLSKHIKTIETELGHDLFIRSKRAVQLTDFGKQFLPYATQIANIQKEYATELLNTDLSVKKITIGYIPMVTLYTFMKFFSEFVKKNPEYEYSFLIGSHDQLIEWLHQKKVDFIITSAPDDPSDLYRSIPYRSDDLVVALPANHRLAEKEHLTFRDLRYESFIEFSQNDYIKKLLQQKCEDEDIRIAYKIDKESIIFDCVEHGLGVSVLTRRIANHYTDKKIVIRELLPRTTYDMYMVYLNKAHLSAATSSFVKYLETR